MIKILNKENSIANHFLHEMRHKDIQNDRGKFKNNLKRLGMLMAYEISKTFEFEEKKVKTSLGEAESKLVKNQPVIIGILRAAIPFYNGFMEVFDEADGGFIGAFREEGDEIKINMGYCAAPNLEGREVIITDPMLATGKSLVQSIEKLLNNGIPSHIHIASVVAAPEGIDYISDSLKISNTIWVYALDQKLNGHAYIVPGLGDAGDLCFGEKL